MSTEEETCFHFLEKCFAISANVVSNYMGLTLQLEELCKLSLSNLLQFAEAIAHVKISVNFVTSRNMVFIKSTVHNVTTESQAALQYHVGEREVP